MDTLTILGLLLVLVAIVGAFAAVLMQPAREDRRRRTSSNGARAGADYDSYTPIVGGDYVDTGSIFGGGDSGGGDCGGGDGGGGGCD